MKGKFLSNTKPPLVAMISSKTKTDMITDITTALYDGADAFGITLCNVKAEYRSREMLTEVFAACAGKPIYIFCYPTSECADLTHEECADLLLFAAEIALEYGPVLCDIMCDQYRKSENGFCYDEDVAIKQRALADRIHEMGAEVLYSVHHKDFLGEEEIVRQAHEQVARGADVVKLVTQANTRSELSENIKIINRLAEELGRPFLYLSSGKYSYLVRQLGPSFGVCMYLCVDGYNEFSTRLQPSLASCKAIRDNSIIVS